MRRKLLLLNLAMAVLAAAAGWQIHDRWQKARERERRVLGQTVRPVSVNPGDPPAPAPAVQATGYLDVAEKLLFARDRNPAVVVEETAPQPMPALPVAHGVIALGGEATVILSEKPGAPQRRYLAGEQVGEFKLVSVTPAELVFQWDGQEIRKAVEELVDRKAAPVEAAAAAPAPQQPKTEVKVLQTAEPTGPGIDVGGSMRACAPGDTSPAGTVREGYRKVIRPSAVGTICMWEPLR